MKAAIVCLGLMILIGFIFKTYISYRERTDANRIDSNDPKP
jgi:hypothetical protein